MQGLLTSNEMFFSAHCKNIVRQKILEGFFKVITVLNSEEILEYFRAENYYIWILVLLRWISGMELTKTFHRDLGKNPKKVQGIICKCMADRRSVVEDLVTI